MKTRFISCVLILVAAFIQDGCSPEKKPEFLLRASLLTNEQHTQFKAFKHFEKLLFDKSGGRLKLETYPSEQLAKEIEAIRMIQAGVIDMTVTGSLLNNWIEIAAFCELPFLIKDSADMHRVLKGPVGRKIQQEMLNTTGLRILGYFQAGARQLTSNRPIRHPNDLQGLIVRVPNVPSFITVWSALGAKPTPMAYSEVFISLQQGTIEALENPLAMVKAERLYEVQKYVNLTSHVVSWVYPVIGEAQFQKLPKDLQSILLEAALEMQRYEHQLFLAGDREVRKDLEMQGMEFIQVDQAAFREVGSNAVYQSLSQEMQEIYDQIIRNR